MGLPGGGKVHLSPRFTRFFNIVFWNKMPQDSMKLIFNTIIQHFYSKFIPEVVESLNECCQVILEAYQEIAKILLPIPRKSFYMFNLRDVTKVFQGLCEVKSNTITTKPIFISLINHELDRVFMDRLIEQSDSDE